MIQLFITVVIKLQLKSFIFMDIIFMDIILPIYHAESYEYILILFM